MLTPPPFRRRPALDRWRRDRNLSLRRTAELIVQAGHELGLDVSCSDETVRRICLPFDDRRRRRPSADILRCIQRLTAGELGTADFPPAEMAA